MVSWPDFLKDGLMVVLRIVAQNSVALFHYFSLSAFEVLHRQFQNIFLYVFCMLEIHLSYLILSYLLSYLLLRFYRGTVYIRRVFSANKQTNQNQRKKICCIL